MLGDLTFLVNRLPKNHLYQTMEELATLAIKWRGYYNDYYVDIPNTFALIAQRTGGSVALFRQLDYREKRVFHLEPGS